MINRCNVFLRWIAQRNVFFQLNEIAVVPESKSNGRLPKDSVSPPAPDVAPGEVIDLGVMVPAQTIIDAAIEHRAVAIGLSGQLPLDALNTFFGDNEHGKSTDS